ncbi:MAG: SurA N-terminal domain-containing protein [Candidatus Babeliales bacterium]
MITVIRRQLIENKAYKVFIWGMIILMIISLGLPSIMNQSSQQNSWVALVNDTPIAYDEYSRKVADYEYKIRMFRQQFGDSFMQALNPQTLALDTLIRNELLGQVARMVPVALDEEVVHNALSDTDFVYQELSDIVPPDVIDPTRGINEDQLNQHLRALHISQTEFHDKVTDSMQRSLIKDLVGLSAYTPLTQLKQQYMHEYATKKFSVLKVSYQDCFKIAQKNGVSDQELQAFFDANNSASGSYYLPENRAGIVATVHARDYGIVVSDSEIEQYYNDHKTQEFIDTPVQVQVRHVVVASAEQAQQLRTELVQHPEKFAAKGKLLPVFARTSTNEPVRERAAFLLKEDGAISEIITTSEGFEILQRVKRIPATYISLAQATKKIRATVTNASFSTLFTKGMAEVVQKSEKERGILDWYVKEHTGTIVEHPLTDNDGSMVMTQLFNLKNGQSTYYVEGDTATIVMLTRIEPRHIPALDAVRSKVERDYYAQQAQQMVQDMIHTVQAESTTHAYAELSKRYKLSLITTPSFKKGDSAILTSLQDQHLPVSKMLQIEKIGATISEEHEGDGYIVRLDEISPIYEQEFELHKKDLIAQIGRENAQMVDAGFVASLYRHATIKQNELLLTT